VKEDARKEIQIKGETGEVGVKVTNNCKKR
jgi:hypothetical protein